MNPERANQFHLVCLSVMIFAVGCAEATPEHGPGTDSSDLNADLATQSRSLVEARSNFRTNIVRRIRADSPTQTPPPELFNLVKYVAPVGALDAYVTPDPGDGTKHPAIVWIFGGFNNSIDETAWDEDATPDNDQSARAFREAGIVMMFPSFRGGNQNPGSIETFYGEVDDVLAAADFLTSQEYVDPNRIYLGGHSTGGTLALLVAAYSDRFRAVFSLGPTGNIVGYGVEDYGFDINSRPEFELRDPILWLDSIETPTFVIEGEGGNVGSLREMAQSTQNPNLHFFPVPGTDHFGVLDPVTRVLAEKVSRDTNVESNLILTQDDFNRAVQQR